MSEMSVFRLDQERFALRSLGLSGLAALGDFWDAEAAC